MNKRVLLALALFLFSFSVIVSADGIQTVNTGLDLTPGSINISQSGTLVTAFYLPDNSLVIQHNGSAIANLKLGNKVSNGNLEDCEITICKLNLIITPNANTSLANLQGSILKQLKDGVTYNSQSSFSYVEVLKTTNEPVYSITDNPYQYVVSNSTRLVSNFTKTQTGFNQVSNFIKLNESEILPAGVPVSVNFVFTRKYSLNLDTDLSIYAFGYLVNSGYLDPWWNTTFTKFDNYTINTTVSSNLTDFPVFVSMNTTAKISAGDMDGRCVGIRVLDKTDTVLLAQEVENGTCDTNNTIIWFKLPIASSVPFDNEVHVYYDNTSAVAKVDNGSAVFSNGFVQVLHLGEQNGNYSDSTNNYNSTSVTNVTNVGAGTGLCSRGGCAKFGAGNGNVNFGNVAPISVDDNLSIEFWINSTDSSQFMEVYGKQYVIDFGKWQNKTTYAFFPSATDQIWQGTKGTNYTTNAWEFEAVTYKVSTGSSLILYFNASPITGSWVFGTGNAPPINYTSSLQLNPTATYIGIPGWTATVDEVRRSNVIRSQDWITAEYLQTFTNWATNNLTVTSPPAYTSVSTTPANFSVWSSGIYVSFNVSWNDTTGSEVFNLDGVNFSVVTNTNLSASKLSAGYHSWYSFANNSAGNKNQTPVFSFYLQPANASLVLLLNSLPLDLTLLVGQTSNSSVPSTNTAYSISVSLYRNGTFIQIGSVPPQLDNLTIENTLGTFNITACFAGDTNYTSYSISRFINVVSSVSSSGSGSGSNGVTINNQIVLNDDLPLGSNDNFLAIIAVTALAIAGVYFTNSKSKVYEEKEEE